MKSARQSAAHLNYMGNLTAAPAALTNSPVALSALDRCDRCGAQAYVRFENTTALLAMGYAEFLLCAHHANQNDLALHESGFAIAADDRDKLAPGNRQQGTDHA